MTARLDIAADKADIHELGARFDNALDREDEGRFVNTFADDGALDGFWGSSSGHEAIAQAFHFMLGTFARDKRHVVSNHEIDVDGDTATMFSYLTVFDRRQLAVTGTATFSDRLVRRDGRWLFSQRVLATDPNVQPIIDSLKNSG